MKFKQKIAYMVLGSLFTLAGYVLATLTTGGITTQTATAQQDNADPIADVIQCRELQIINDEGNKVATLGTNFRKGAILDLYNKDGIEVITLSAFNGGILQIRNAEGKLSATLSPDQDGGKLVICGKNENIVVSIMANEDGGTLRIFNHDPPPVKKVVVLAANEVGGFIGVSDYGSKTTGAFITVNEFGGALGVFNKDKEVVGMMEAIEDGGALHIKNKDGKTVVLIGAAENGNGVISAFKGSWREH